MDTQAVTYQKHVRFHGLTITSIHDRCPFQLHCESLGWLMGPEGKGAMHTTHPPSLVLQLLPYGNLSLTGTEHLPVACSKPALVGEADPKTQCECIHRRGRQTSSFLCSCHGSNRTEFNTLLQHLSCLFCWVLVERPRLRNTN